MKDSFDEDHGEPIPNPSLRRAAESIVSRMILHQHSKGDKAQCVEHLKRLRLYEHLSLAHRGYLEGPPEREE